MYVFRMSFVAVVYASVLVSVPVASAADPERTVTLAATSLDEIMAVPLKSIPEALIADAQAVAIFPNVVKVGFVVGGQRGHGVIVIRNADGNWEAPRFLTITGGSVGWQIGAQATDVVLVFKNRETIDGVLRGKFTIGADANAAAGPVGRSAKASTDAELRAEMLSYSRSRGLFAGVSLEGSMLQPDAASEGTYYRKNLGGEGVVPESAVNLVKTLLKYTPSGSPAPGTEVVGGTPMPAATPIDETELTRRELAASATGLAKVLDASWQRYLALPAEVFADGGRVDDRTLKDAISRFDAVASNPQYRALNTRKEFQTTRQLLQRFNDLQSPTGATALPLPPPPM